MRRMLIFLSATILLVGSISPSATADTTYNYTGPQFNTFVDPNGLLPPGVTGLTGWLTLSGPLGPNFDGSVTPLSFSFTDGATIINNLNDTGFTANFVTNGDDKLIGWSLKGWIETPASDWIETPITEFFIDGPSSSAPDDKTSYFSGAAYASTNAVGSFSTPEPPASLLLAFGLTALVWVSRRLRPYFLGSRSSS